MTGHDDRTLLTGLLQGLNESLVYTQEIVAVVRTMMISSTFAWDGRPWFQLNCSLLGDHDPSGQHKDGALGTIK